MSGAPAIHDHKLNLSAGVAVDSLHYVADLIPNIGGAAFDALIDRSASPETMEKLAGIIANWPGLYGYHDLKTRTAGTKLFVQVHIALDGGQGLRAAYNISKALKRGILVAYPQADVIIHKDLARKTDGI